MLANNTNSISHLDSISFKPTFSSIPCQFLHIRGICSLNISDLKLKATMSFHHHRSLLRHPDFTIQFLCGDVNLPIVGFVKCSSWISTLLHRGLVSHRTSWHYNTSLISALKSLKNMRLDGNPECPLPSQPTRCHSRWMQNLSKTCTITKWMLHLCYCIQFPLTLVWL